MLSDLCVDPVGIPDDFLIKCHTVPQSTLMDVLVQRVDGAVLLFVDVQGGKADAVGADLLEELGIGAAGHHIGADLDTGVDVCRCSSMTSSTAPSTV